MGNDERHEKLYYVAFLIERIVDGWERTETKTGVPYYIW
jgi:hypothetical protein